MLFQVLEPRHSPTTSRAFPLYCVDLETVTTVFFLLIFSSKIFPVSQGCDRALSWVQAYGGKNVGPVLGPPTCPKRVGEWGEHIRLTEAVTDNTVLKISKCKQELSGQGLWKDNQVQQNIPD